MNNLLDFVINAHGGLDNWRKFRKVSARLNVGGLTWVNKQQPDILKNTYVTVDTTKQFVSYQQIGNAEWHTSFLANRVAIESADGEIIEELLNPRQSFSEHGLATPWTKLQTFYFASYAIWTYFNAPFNFAEPGYQVKEIEPWEENNEHWRRLQVIFPQSVATHNPTQTFYIDREGLIRRHDYNVEIVANASSCHYLDNYVEIQGIKIPTKRRVYIRKADNNPMVPEPLLVSIDISEIALK